MSITEKWRAIYRTLFPDVQEVSIPGPFFDISETAKSVWDQLDPQEYEMHLKQNLRRRIIAKLNEEFQILAEHTKQRLVEIVQTESIEVFREYVQSKGMHSSSLGVDDVPDRHSDDAPPSEARPPDILGDFLLPGVLGGPSEAFTLEWTPRSPKGQGDSAYESVLLDWGNTEETGGGVREP
ncbi:uncharacterized protein DNG_09201 [Cephalotrichum gorgonifer]|uniref:Uncharacterized protein n=1 Tax=Cephalotrichum gorgonifer TaxID=2041049 RepID=A0AAE8SZ29_9PEZI|nr:uncharacterized protein DNG_09201 [Cephalotrichum gorgonifer]